MRRIKLTNCNKYALIEDRDYDIMIQYKWWRTAFGYAKGWCKKQKKAIWMHRLIMNTPKGKFTDHKNQNRLDNRRKNLRICSKAENGWYRTKPTSNKSGHKGISWDKNRKKWRVVIDVDSRYMLIGRYDTLKISIAFRNTAIRVFHGKFAKT